MLILRVAIPTPLRRLFDYLVPKDMVYEKPESLIGTRILVPFRAQKKVGLIVEIADQTDVPLHKLKTAETILDPSPLLSPELLKLLHWASRYYHCSFGEIFETAVPKKLRQEPKIKQSSLETTILKKRKIKKIDNLEILSITDTNDKDSVETPFFVNNDLQLNEAQTLAVNAIYHQLRQHRFQTFLLNGVTGSGKTEVYIRSVQAVLAEKKQALILVPEIGLTPQLVSRFQQRFSVPIAVLNSSLTEKQRYLAWENARMGKAQIVIGTRSAAFVPLKNPGIFIIDEEHDTSFKQQEGFRYHARDLLIMRASIENCPIVLGSATPSLETLHNARVGRFQNLILPLRAGSGTFPTVQVLDIRHKKCESGLSAELITQMHEHIDRQGQVLLFLNRRGFAPILMCFECGWVFECPNCDARLTLHHRDHKLQCHHCEYLIPIPKDCPGCHHKNLKPIGVGTERLETTLQKHFPNQAIARIDRDTTRGKGTLQEKINTIQNQETQILLGTQMIAKGHHFPNVTLVGILDVDHALFSADFRSIEKMGQLITQVAGRTGRAEKPGKVLLQTCHPDHPLLKKLLTEGYLGLSRLLLTERQSTLLPPYSYQAMLRAEGKTLAQALQFLEFAKNHAEIRRQNQSNNKFKILGPIPAPMERRLGKHRAQLLFQTAQRSLLQNLLQPLVHTLEEHPLASRIRWSLDIDPIEMY